jgi:hypothetical protein
MRQIITICFLLIAVAVIGWAFLEIYGCISRRTRKKRSVKRRVRSLSTGVNK